MLNMFYLLGSVGGSTCFNRIKLVVDDVVVMNFKAAKTSYDSGNQYRSYTNMGFSCIKDWTWATVSSSAPTGAGGYIGIARNYSNAVNIPWRENHKWILRDFSPSLYECNEILTSYGDGASGIYIFKDYPLKFNKNFKVYVGFDFINAGYPASVYVRYDLKQ